MKNLCIAGLVSLLSFKTINAQYFIGDIIFNGNVAIFTIKPQGGDITGHISIVKYFIRWEKSQGNNFTFSSIINNTSDFPDLYITTENNEVMDSSYYNQQFSFMGLTTPSRTYINGTTYELFRTTLGGSIPSTFDLVANNSAGPPYYFAVQGDGSADYSAYVVSPFVNPTDSNGTFFYKTFSLEPLPVTLKSFTGKAIDCKALLTWTTSSEINSKHFEIEQSSDGINFTTASIVAAAGNTGGDQAYSKLLPLSSAANFYRLKSVSFDDKPKYSNVVLLKGKDCIDRSFKIQVIPNPVTNHELNMLLTLPEQDNLDIKIINMAGSLVAQFRQSVNTGTSLLKFQLPRYTTGQYMVCVQSPNNGIITQKIIVE
jgi:hypothetical protein